MSSAGIESYLHDIRNELKKHNEYIKEMVRMFKCIDLDGEAVGALSLSKEYRDKLEEIRQAVGAKTLTETMEMLVDDKVEYFKEYLKEK